MLFANISVLVSKWQSFVSLSIYLLDQIAQTTPWVVVCNQIWFFNMLLK